MSSATLESHVESKLKPHVLVVQVCISIFTVSLPKLLFTEFEFNHNNHQVSISHKAVKRPQGYLE